MAHTEDTIQTKRRESRGTRDARRLRANGNIPAVLYGHGEETLSIAVPTTQFSAALRHGSRLVNLSGDVQDKALVKDIQWDVWGNEVLHIDFTRVSADEKIELAVPVETRGVAPGISEGGIVTLMVHEFTIECLATNVPEKIEVNINNLHLEQDITVADLELPEGIVLQAEPEAVVVQCTTPVEEADEDEVGESAEPEVIGKAEEEGEGSGS